MNNFLTFDKLDKYNIKNAFIGIPYDFSNKNNNTKEDIVKLLDVDYQKIYHVVQTHSDEIAIVEKFDNVNDNKFKNKDGLITNVKGTTLVIKTADCQGIFLYDPIKQVIGNIHSGWVGTTKKIILKAIDKMIINFDCNKDDIICCINPSIKDCHFEIELNKQILIDYGIKVNNIYVQDVCTFCNNSYHSYRRDNTSLRNGCVISL